MLFGWMKSLIMYLIISGIVINLSPGKSYKRYLSLFSGLIVIIIVASPLTYIFDVSIGDMDDITGGLYESMEAQSSMDGIYDYYDCGMRAAMMNTLKEAGINPDNIDITTDMDNRVLGCRVYISGKPREEQGLSLDMESAYALEDEKIKNILKQVYILEQDSIYIVRR